MPNRVAITVEVPDVGIDESQVEALTRASSAFIRRVYNVPVPIDPDQMVQVLIECLAEQGLGVGWYNSLLEAYTNVAQAMMASMGSGSQGHH